jgi:hypothetical protein
MLRLVRIPNGKSSPIRTGGRSSILAERLQDLWIPQTRPTGTDIAPVIYPGHLLWTARGQVGIENAEMADGDNVAAGAVGGGSSSDSSLFRGVRDCCVSFLHLNKYAS